MKPYLYGLLASLSLLSVYGATMTLLSGWDAAIEQFFVLWYLMIPLAIGFGIQVGLYTALKTSMQKRTKGTLAVGGTTSGTAMLACCAHHATDVLPFLGLSGVSIFLTQFQKPILLASLGINFLGIYIIFKRLKHKMVSRTPIILVSIATVTILAVWIISAQYKSIETPVSITPPWETKELTGGNVTIAITPITLRPLSPASFDVAFETHSVNLDFDVETIVDFTDENGTQYIPHWQGSPPGGHHRKGTLVFTPDIAKPTTVTLVFRDIAGIPSRTFTWEIKKP